MGVEKGWVGVRNGGVKSGDDRLVMCRVDPFDCCLLMLGLHGCSVP